MLESTSMNHVLPVPLLVALSITACSSHTVNKTPIEVRSYEVSKGNQIQLVASDLAVELGVDGIEWNEQLRPWDYETLRSRVIDISNNDPQSAYFSLFSDTGLLPYYDIKQNRVFVEPFQSQIKKTVKFEPEFTSASNTAKQLQVKHQAQELSKGSTQEFQMYRDETLQATLSGWAREAGYQKVVWYIKDQNLISLLSSKNRSSMTIVERSPLQAIKALLNSLNSSSHERAINYRVFSQGSYIVFHEFKETEPFKVIEIPATNTKDVMTLLAKEYGASLDYQAPSYLIKEPFATVVTSRLQNSVREIMAGYPLKVSFVESTNTIKVEK